MLGYHLFEQLGLFVIQLDSFLYIGHIENFFCRHCRTADKQFFHKLIVAYPEVSETSETCAWVHKEADKYPACRVQYFFCGQMSAVDLIYSKHQIVKIRETLLTAVIFIYDSGGTGRNPAFALVMTFYFQTFFLA